MADATPCHRLAAASLAEGFLLDSSSFKGRDNKSVYCLRGSINLL